MKRIFTLGVIEYSIRLGSAMAGGIAYGRYCDTPGGLGENERF